jgi:carbonic anhydrase
MLFSLEIILFFMLSCFGAEIEFDYNNQKLWSEISPLCATTLTPIDINDSVLRSTQHLEINYQNSAANISNTGHSLELTFPGVDNYILWNGNIYYLKQIHLHSPAEHRIYQEFFPLEFHLVHVNEMEEILVMGFTFNVASNVNPTFDNLIYGISNVQNNGQSCFISDFPLSTFKNAELHTFYQYVGSLTTPPCSQNVQWLLSTTSGSIGAEHFNIIKKTMKYNARYIQI